MRDNGVKSSGNDGAGNTGNDSDEEEDTGSPPLHRRLHLRDRGAAIREQRELQLRGSISRSNSVHIGLGYGLSPSHDSPAEQSKTAIVEAVVALWTQRLAARGLRQWVTVNLTATDPRRFQGRNVNDEARRILRSAENARQAMLKEETDEELADDQIEPSPPSVRFTRDDLDLLLVWCKQTQTKTFGAVDEGATAEVLRHLRFQVYENGDVLFYEGEVGETFYVVFKGKVAVYVGMPATSSHRLGPHRRDNRGLHMTENEIGKRVFAYHTGESLGETAMFADGAVRSASAVAVGRCEICELHRDIYRRTLLSFHQQSFECARKLNFLQRVDMFADWTRERLASLAAFLEKRQLHFGDTLFVEHNSVLTGCFFVLSGTVKLSKLIALDSMRSLNEGQNCVEAALAIARQPKKPHRVDLQVISIDEAVGLEGLLNTNTHADYTATATSATVELYSLRESDARSIIGAPQSSFHQRLRALCVSSARQRDTNVARARQILLKQQETIADEYDRVQGRPVRTPGSVCNAVDFTLRDEGASPSRLETVPASLINDGTVPYLPSLDAPKLMEACGPISQLSKTRGVSPRREQPTLNAVVAPKMLSFTVKNFILSNWDTLAGDYLDRTSRQFPVTTCSSCDKMAKSPVSMQGSRSARDAIPSHASFEQQTILDQQLARMYDSKMHWDIKTHRLLMQAPTTSEKQPRRDHKAQHLDVVDQLHSVCKPSMPQYSEKQKRSTPNGNRRLVPSSSQRTTQQPPRSGTSDSMFIHFFSDS